MAAMTLMTMMMTMLLVMMMRGQYAATEAAGSARLAAVRLRRQELRPAGAFAAAAAASDQRTTWESGVEVRTPPSANPGQASPPLGQEVTEGLGMVRDLGRSKSSRSRRELAEIFDVSGLWLRFSESCWAEAARWSPVSEGIWIRWFDSAAKYLDQEKSEAGPIMKSVGKSKNV